MKIIPFLILPCAVLAICLSGCIENCTAENPAWSPEQPVPDMAVAPTPDGSCIANSQCESGLCLDYAYFPEEPPGTCVPEARIRYVNNEAKLSGNGRKKSPYIDVNAALTDSGKQRPYILIKPSKRSYGVIKITDQQEEDIALIGPWADPALTVRSQPVSTEYWGTAPSAVIDSVVVKRRRNVYIDGVHINGNRINDIGIDCVASLILLVRRSIIEECSRIGINHSYQWDTLGATSCADILINRSLVRNNETGLLVNSNTRYSGEYLTSIAITNSVVSGSKYWGAYVTGGGVKSFWASYNTIYNNLETGIDCHSYVQSRICGTLFADNFKVPTAANMDMSLDMGTRGDMSSDMGSVSVPQTKCRGPQDQFLEISSTAAGLQLGGVGIVDPSNDWAQRMLIDKGPDNCPTAGLGDLDLRGIPRPQGPAGAEKLDYGAHEAWYGSQPVRNPQ